MRSVMSRLVCCLLAAVLLSVCIQEVSIPVKAAYENTYVNTGDQRADLIGVALTQVGYREGANNYTKYGQWYGAPNTAWCGMFISWCANQAGIPTSVLKKNGFASASGFGIPSYYATQKTPRPGDLFFKTSGGHTGIVYYVEGDYFYTLEGNTDEYSNNGVGVFIRKPAGLRRGPDHRLVSSGTGSRQYRLPDSSIPLRYRLRGTVRTGLWEKQTEVSVLAFPV